MRLLTFDERGEVTLTRKLFDGEIPPYAILSHTWGADEDEVSFNDMVNGTFNRDCGGLQKIHFCIRRARVDNISHFWIDTCCIDKASSSELSEAIQSMFHWYREAVKCYVYLSDCRTLDLYPWPDSVSICCSRWFTRGWTLQELLAPNVVEFYSSQGQFLGDKSNLEPEINAATGIPVAALRGSPLFNISVKERMSWAANRNTKRREDKAYCLLGIFDVNMPLLYGERDKALARLWEEIKKADGQRTTQAYEEQQRINALIRTASASLPALQWTPDALETAPPRFARSRTPNEEEIQKADRHQTTKPYEAPNASRTPTPSNVRTIAIIPEIDQTLADTLSRSSLNSLLSSVEPSFHNLYVENSQLYYLSSSDEGGYRALLKFEHIYNVLCNVIPRQPDLLSFASTFPAWKHRYNTLSILMEKLVPLIVKEVRAFKCDTRDWTTAKGQIDRIQKWRSANSRELENCLLTELATARRKLDRQHTSDHMPGALEGSGFSSEKVVTDVQNSYQEPQTRLSETPPDQTYGPPSDRASTPPRVVDLKQSMFYRERQRDRQGYRHRAPAPSPSPHR